MLWKRSIILLNILHGDIHIKSFSYKKLIILYGSKLSEWWSLHLNYNDTKIGSIVETHCQAAFGTGELSEVCLFFTYVLFNDLFLKNDILILQKMSIQYILERKQLLLMDL